jgi:bis(5'-nucleosyl)-tetraphosphatase (symmetrical)
MTHPETWAIGDLQGCLDPLIALEAQLPAEARIWLTGDIVNRGPRSLDTLRWAMGQGDRVVTVLGNHDLHLLAVFAGVRKPHRSDTLGDILAAPDRDALLDWVRSRPLAHAAQGWLMVHAGVLPQWTVARTLALASEVHRVLAGPDWLDFVRVMYGNEPDRWDDGLAGHDRLRVIVNALTRLRFCTADGRMEFATKEGADAAPADHHAWFDVPGRASAGTPIVFGHWSTLGLVQRPDLLGIDTGCIWGGPLTAVRLGDRKVLQVPCAQALKPG